MLAHRTFNVVIVKDAHGIGGELTAKPDRIIEYSGQSTSVTIGEAP
jgi:hypothetical protein